MSRDDTCNAFTPNDHFPDVCLGCGATRGEHAFPRRSGAERRVLKGHWTHRSDKRGKLVLRSRHGGHWTDRRTPMEPEQRDLYGPRKPDVGDCPRCGNRLVWVGRNPSSLLCPTCPMEPEDHEPSVVRSEEREVFNAFLDGWDRARMCRGPYNGRKEADAYMSERAENARHRAAATAAVEGACGAFSTLAGRVCVLPQGHEGIHRSPEGHGWGADHRSTPSVEGALATRGEDGRGDNPVSGRAGTAPDKAGLPAGGIASPEDREPSEEVASVEESDERAAGPGSQSGEIPALNASKGGAGPAANQRRVESAASAGANPSPTNRENARHRAAATAAVEEGSAGEAGLVERLAARWVSQGCNAYDGPLGMSKDVARFFLLAIADDENTPEGWAEYLRTEATR